MRRAGGAGPAPRGLARLAAAVLAALAALVMAAPAALAATAGESAAAGTSAVAGPAGPAAFLHAALASTQPADGSVVSKAPRQVSASFDQPVGVSADSLEVYSPSGQRVDEDQTVHVSSYEIADDLLPGLGTGTYTAVWHVISADTHPVEGAFTFSVSAPSATHVGALLPASDTTVSDLFAVVRWVEYLCYALLGGGVAFLIACWPDGARRRGVGRLVTASALGLLASTLLGLLLQGPYGAGTGLNQLFSGALVRTTLHSNLGPASEAREILSLVAGGAASFLLPWLPGAAPRARLAAGAAWALLVTGLAATWAVYDHASTGVQTPWGIPVDIVHLDAMALWIGGLAVLAGFALRPAAGPGSAQDAEGAAHTAAAARAVPRFSAIALGCVAAIIASGVYQTWREVGTWGALFDTTYGRLIIAKITGLILLIELGYFARRLIRRGLSPAAGWRFAGARPLPTRAALTRGTAMTAAGTLTAEKPVAAPLAPDAEATTTGTATGPGAAAPGGPGSPAGPDGGTDGGTGSSAGPVPGPAWRPAMRQLRRSVAAELVVAVVVLALTAVLVNTATGREAYAPTVSAAQRFNTGGPGGAGTVHVFAEPARLGPNTIEVYFTQAGGQAFIPAQVTAALYFPAQEIGPLPVILTRTAPGQYRAENTTVTFTGRWSLQLIVRSDAFDETSVSFPLNIHLVPSAQIGYISALPGQRH
jgi:copper transport protein